MRSFLRRARYRGTPIRIGECSFCGQAQAEVEKLVYGPQVAICDECVALCVEVLEETRLSREGSRPRPGERAGQLGEHSQVGVEPDSLKAKHSQRQ